MNKGILVGGLAVLGALGAATATAGPLGFNGAYDYATWTPSANALGVGGFTPNTTIDGPQQTLTLFEPDIGDEGNGANGNDFSHVVVSTGIISFDWSFNWDIDDCCSGADVYVNGTLFNLANGSFANPDNDADGDASGHFSMLLNAGDILTLEAFSSDTCCRAANFQITNFDAVDGAVPEPTSAALIGSGLLGVLFAARKRRKA